MNVNGQVIREGEWISINGTTGEVYLGKIDMVVPSLEEQKDLLTLLEWADEICARPGTRKFPEGWPTTGLQVWANADYPRDAQRARAYGAKGIGLCRTEHMFFEESRLPIVQRMILAKTSEERVAALNELLPEQRSDFEGLFEAMDGLPVIIRLIDPPLHEFLPEDELIEEIIAARRTTWPASSWRHQEIAAKEAMRTPSAPCTSNPMMGLRGVRLSIVMPERPDAGRDLRGGCQCGQGIQPKPEVMIPLTGTSRAQGHPADARKDCPRRMQRRAEFPTSSVRWWRSRAPA